MHTEEESRGKWNWGNFLNSFWAASVRAILLLLAIHMIAGEWALSVDLAATARGGNVSYLAAWLLLFFAFWRPRQALNDPLTGGKGD